MATALEDIQEAHDIRLDIRIWILYRIAHTGLTTEVQHVGEMLLGKETGDGLTVGEVHLHKMKTGQRCQVAKSGLLERRTVVVVDIVDANNFGTLGGKNLNHLVTDKAGRAGNKNLHCLPLFFLYITIFRE